MEQPTLTSQYAGVPDTGLGGADATALSTTRNRPPLLRRISRSDPHLDIPHFVSVQDKGFHPFHHVLSGLFEGNSTFSVNKLGSNDKLNISAEHKDLVPSQEGLKPPASSLDRNKSAVELASQDPSNQLQQYQGLRKSSTISNYGANAAAENQSSLLSYAPHFFSGTHAKEHPDDQGLMMSVRPSSSAAAALSSASGLQSSMSDSSSSSTMSPTNAGAHHGRGGMMGIFGRGFFAKPVIENQEDTYRYVMALDRF
ncbi:hypothetical protein AAVH_01112 [Aphelenchoides avenae]|nr:hypothetical protein AAVH_01112 [Aphelenchus avenae]